MLKCGTNDTNEKKLSLNWPGRGMPIRPNKNNERTKRTV